MEEVRQDRDGGCGARRDADGTNPVWLHRLTARRNAARGFEEEILVKSGRDATAGYEVRAREMLLTITRCLSAALHCLLA